MIIFGSKLSEIVNKFLVILTPGACVEENSLTIMATTHTWSLLLRVCSGEDSRNFLTVLDSLSSYS